MSKHLRVIHWIIRGLGQWKLPKLSGGPHGARNAYRCVCVCVAFFFFDSRELCQIVVACDVIFGVEFGVAEILGYLSLTPRSFH